MAFRKWGTETLVNTTTDNGQFAPVVTALKEGGYVVAWVDDMGTGQSVVKFQIYTAGGAKLGTEKIVPTSDGDGDQDQPTITTTANGNFIIGVRDFDSATDHDAMAYEYTPYGANPGQQVRIFTLNSAGAFDSSAPVVDFSGSTNTFVYKNGFGIYAQRINANGTVEIAETDQVILAGAGPFDFARLKSGQFAGESLIVVARDVAVGDHELVISRRGSNLHPSFNDVVASTMPIENISVCELDERVFLENSCIVAYEVNGQVRLINATNASRNSIGSLDNATMPEVMTYVEGQFLMSYRSTITSDLYLQLYEQSGAKIGLPVKINTHGQNANTDPDIEVLADGRIIVVWEETSGFDGAGSGVFQQIIDPRDGMINGSDDPLLVETLYGNDASNDEIIGFAGNDSLYGLGGTDALYGGDGTDQLVGGRGDDTLYGGADGDTLIGGLGADEIFGDAGTDTVSYVQSRVGVQVNLLTGEGFGGDAEGDTITGVENVIGSNFGDVIVGGNFATARIESISGDDNLTGGTGADTLVGGVGADTINGLGGTDRANYSASSAVTINLLTNVNTGGEAQGDVLTNIEEVSGSAFADIITGNTLKNHLLGQSGADRLDGGVGADTLTGGGGSDSFVFNFSQSGTTSTTHDYIADYTKGVVGVGDEIDASVTLLVGGAGAVLSASQATINAAGVATFAAGSGTTLADALNDISNSINVGGTIAGEFAFFLVNNTSAMHMFISDGVAGIGAGDVLVRMTGVTSVGTISIDAGDVTILT